MILGAGAFFAAGGVGATNVSAEEEEGEAAAAPADSAGKPLNPGSPVWFSTKESM